MKEKSDQMFDDKHSNELLVVQNGWTITHGGFM